jgi:hypothetical protein
MTRSSRLPKTANLSESIHHQLNMYALAASAAGVGMLAVAIPAEAKIVYTPAHKHLPLNTFFYLDLNHDGTNDFKFALNSLRTSYGTIRSLNVDASLQSNQAEIVKAGSHCAAALPKGARIGSKAPFYPYFAPLQMFIRQVFSSGRTASYCPWLKVNGKKQAYLGLKFSVKGKIHFGWARFGNIQPGRKPTAELTGYAYETTANKSIIAGQTKGRYDVAAEAPNASVPEPASEHATLGMLALGASALSIWRREE